MIAQDGISLISGGLDYWFQHEDGGKDSANIEQNEFRIEEWRLQRRLDVEYFCLPPDYRDTREDSFNKFLKVPFLRFPQWHFCPSCKCLFQLSLTDRGRRACPLCLSNKGKKFFLAQVPFVAMCEKGHIRDFPWREWVHKTVQPECNGNIRIIATGGSSLSAELVKCDCGMERSLARITEARPDGLGTELSSKLDASGILFLCKGQSPWLGTDRATSCDYPLRGSLRNASNLYYADVRSAIYLPPGNNDISPELILLLEKSPLSDLIGVLSRYGEKIIPRDLRNQHPLPLKNYSDEEINKAIQVILSKKEQEYAEAEVESDDPETAFRRAEFNTLREAHKEELLIIKESNIASYQFDLGKYFSKIMLVSKLRETRALAGFTRIFPVNDMSLEERKAMLRLSSFDGSGNWLPAYIVYGEGIFLELNENQLQVWEQRGNVLHRISSLVTLYKQLEKQKKAGKKALSPRLILIHTLSHLIMNRLTFECGYSSAALRERLYVSENPDFPMAGLLIYTAAGDSEGTMGGLVRMGKPGNLESVIQQALVEACWCSADPVCMEMGSHGGQGPMSCNLAACHNCALVPETACEEFNRFLDRGMVVGKSDDRELGYFNIQNFSK